MIPYNSLDAPREPSANRASIRRAAFGSGAIWPRCRWRRPNISQAHKSQLEESLRRTLALDDVQDGILAQSQPMADFTIGLPLADKLKHLWREPIRFDSLPGPTAEYNSTLLSCRDT